MVTIVLTGVGSRRSIGSWVIFGSVTIILVVRVAVVPVGTVAITIVPICSVRITVILHRPGGGIVGVRVSRCGDS